MGSSICGEPEGCGVRTRRSFDDLLILVLVALAARLEAAKKELSEERATQLAADQSLAEEKPARHIAD
jgi:hypothetical protein